MNNTTSGGFKASMFTLITPLLLTVGCGNEAIEANRRQVEANQALIEQTQQQIAMLQANQGAAPPLPSTSVQPAGLRQEGRGDRDPARW